VRLTSNATSYFKNLSFENRSKFFQILNKQLVQVVPISDNRIIVDNFQKDSTSLDQILISMTILKSNNHSVINVSTIVNTLDTLIKNKERTSISKNDLLLMLDESYGIQIHHGK
jgi:hypothetical protein